VEIQKLVVKPPLGPVRNPFSASIVMGHIYGSAIPVFKINHSPGSKHSQSYQGSLNFHTRTVKAELAGNTVFEFHVYIYHRIGGIIFVLGYTKGLQTVHRSENMP